MIRSPWVRQPLAALLLGLTLGGCHSWRVETASASQAIATQPSRSIRVQKRDGEVLVIDKPRVVGDSIQGLMADLPGNLSVAVALSDVQRVETNHFDAGKTWLTLGILTIALGAVAARCAPHCIIGKLPADTGRKMILTVQPR